ncbi:DUF3999 family protein [Granulicella sibirica]|uniref:Uncharacterized protein n=1 Tax=Granulicella sibirica TaxID=2479048 RepID=A0A4Q0T0J2_9BACT|nr:DUF3999 family protein [Granulicella sibirica]RXH55329.1 hypothetical protein GRAN_4433 [Granulicella sibirica]
MASDEGAGMTAGSLLLALVLLQTGSVSGAGGVSDSRFMRWERAVAVTGAGPVCAELDAAVFAHAAPSLKDLRVYIGRQELPYTITLSQAAQPEGDEAKVFDEIERPGEVSFDLEMRDRAYTDVVLNLDGKDFRATASVSGMDDPKSLERTALGSFVLFDMSSKRLSRDTTLALQESRFRYLRVVLRGQGEMPKVRGAEVPPSREAQTVYAPVATESAARGTESVAVFRVPARVPVERVVVRVKDAFKENFSRRIKVTARGDDSGGLAETIEGTVMRVRLGAMRKEEMGIPASLGANLQGDATVEVAIDNADQAPLPVSSVALEMRERRVCFEVPPGANEAILMYGDEGLSAPVYGMGPSLSGTRVATLGPEKLNSGFRARIDSRGFLERHPEVIWVVLLVGLGVFGTVGLRSWRRVGT